MRLNLSEILMLKVFKSCLLIMMFGWVIISASNGSTDSIKATAFIDEELFDNELTVDNDLIEESEELFIDAAQVEVIEIVIFSLATIIHELAHEIVAKSLFDVCKSTVHIGTRTPATTPHFFSLGNMHFYKTIPWTRGLTTYKGKGKEVSNLNMKFGIVIAAGGLTAAVFMYGLLSAIVAYCAYCDNKGFSEIALKSFINGASPFSYILNTRNISIKQKRLLLNATLVICFSLIYNIFYGVTPYRPGDGMKIWKKNMGVTGIPLRVASDVSTLGVWGCWALLIKKYYDARKQLSPQNSHVPALTTLVASLLIYSQLIPKESDDNMLSSDQNWL